MNASVLVMPNRRAISAVGPNYSAKTIPARLDDLHSVSGRTDFGGI